MKRLLLVLVIIILSFLGGWYAHSLYFSQDEIIEPVTKIKPRPLDKYTIENLSETDIASGGFQIDRVLDEEDDYTSYLFEFAFNPSLSENLEKTTTGQVNIPSGDNSYPLVLMLRGYVDQEIYQTGIGTRRAAEYFAQNDFITVAPDFLGYAGSDKESDDIMETRFQTYTTVLSLLESLDQIDQWDKENLFIWGHSNGGQIALIALEITQEPIPTTLWAPVSKPFPYSILYYTDESEDRGKLLRREIARFEEVYDPDLYSLDLYLQRIQAPLQIHQGTADDAIPLDWTVELVEELDELEKDVNFYTYAGADHNLQPAWNTVITRDVEFFRSHIDKNI